VILFYRIFVPNADYSCARLNPPDEAQAHCSIFYAQRPIVAARGNASV
jgi:hypothetical protein